VQQAQIRPSRPDDERVVRLLTELDAYLYRQYPPGEFSADVNHILAVSALLDPSVTFVAAWREDQALGCGAVRRMQDGQGAYAEIKRMFVNPSERGRRLGERIIQYLEDAMRAEGIQRLMLETGTRQPEAQRLYERCGYKPRGPFGEYGDGPVSVFMEKRL
jgi:putative acetyltransferase